MISSHPGYKSYDPNLQTPEPTWTEYFADSVGTRASSMARRTRRRCWVWTKPSAYQEAIQRINSHSKHSSKLVNKFFYLLKFFKLDALLAQRTDFASYRLNKAGHNPTVGREEITHQLESSNSCTAHDNSSTSRTSRSQWMSLRKYCSGSKKAVAL